MFLIISSPLQSNGYKIYIKQDAVPLRQGLRAQRRCKAQGVTDCFFQKKTIGKHSDGLTSLLEN